MPCFVLACGERLARTEAGAPLKFWHPRFGDVTACEDHAAGLMMVTAAYEMVKKTTVVIRCVECGKRPCVCGAAEAGEKR